MARPQRSGRRSLREHLYHALEPTARESGLSAFNVVLVLLVLASFVSLALETEPTLPADWMAGLKVFNIVILCVFAVEYLVRLWIVGVGQQYRGLGGHIRYILTPYALADLLAFLPELLWLMLVPGSGDETTLMVLRVLRLGRLLKIARFVPAFGMLGAALQRAGTQLLTSLALALALVYVSALILYFIEGKIVGQEDAFGSIPRSIWWAVATLTTVGYGDVYPVTPLGKFAAGVIAIAGIGVVALPAGVFASAFSDELRQRTEEKERRRLLAAEERASNDSDFTQGG